MRYNFLTVAIGIALAAALLPLSAVSAQAADPSGYWRKADQGKRPAKQQIYRCGTRAICVKIVWLQEPLDSNGRPLHDVRNSNPQLRGRTIEGLQIVKGMAQVSGNQWKGNIYNPEDGNTYSATITMVSRNKLVLKGCKASIFCRSQEWVRTSPPPEDKPEEVQIEASAEPAPRPAVAAAIAGTAAVRGSGGLANADLARPARVQSNQAGYRYLHPTAGPVIHRGFSGENLNSIFSMTTPLKSGQTQARTATAPRSPVSPQAQPVSAAPSSAQPEPDIASAEAGADQEEATGSVSQAQERMTWRERRQLRRQKRLRELQDQGDGVIPWLR